MDTDLVIRARHGDDEAFANLVDVCGDRLHAVAHRILRDVDLAEDATPQALLTIWRDLPRLRDPARFDAWSYRVLVNACYTESRRARSRCSGARPSSREATIAWTVGGMSSSPSVVGRSRSSMPVDSTMKNGLPPARPVMALA